MRRLLPLALLLSCARKEEAAPQVQAAEVVVRPDSATLPAGGSLQLGGQANDASGRPLGGAPLAFASSDPSVVQVSSRGLLTAPGKTGVAKVTVASGRASSVVAITVDAGAPARLDNAAGDGQRGMIASALPEALRVRLLDDRGNPVAGAIVRFSTESGNIEPAEVRTASDGTAAATWILGYAAGPQLARAACAGASTSFHAQTVAGAPARIVAVGAPPQGESAGGSIAVEALVMDGHGNLVAGAPVLWRVTGGGGVIAPELSTADARGLAASTWTTGRKAGRNLARAAVAAAPETTVELVADTLPGAPSRIVAASAADQRGVSRRDASATPAARVLDSAGNPIPGVAVRFAITGGGGTLQRDVATTDADGVASAGRWTLGGRGANSVQASVLGAQGAALFTARAR